MVAIGVLLLPVLLMFIVLSVVVLIYMVVWIVDSNWKKKVDDLLSQYRPVSLSAREPLIFTAKKELLNAEIISAVMLYKQEMKADIAHCEEIDGQIQKMLSFDQNLLELQKLQHIKSQVSVLGTLKERRDQIYTKIKRKQIRLLHEDKECMEKLQQAFATLLQSKKVNGTKGSKTTKIYCGEKTDSFTFAEKPKDLSMFEFEYDPVILFDDEFYYCLFSNVILVFDVNGTFSTALDPSALRLDTEQQAARVASIDGTRQEHPIVDDDSKPLHLDVVRPDTQYRFVDGEIKSFYERTHEYAYTVLKLTIADRTFGFEMSACSHAIFDSFNKASTQYVRKCNDQHDPLPALIMLLKILSDSGDVVSDSLVHEYGAQGNNYFCKIVSA